MPSQNDQVTNPVRRTIVGGEDETPTPRSIHQLRPQEQVEAIAQDKTEYAIEIGYNEKEAQQVGANTKDALRDFVESKGYKGLMADER